MYQKNILRLPKHNLNFQTIVNLGMPIHVMHVIDSLAIGGAERMLVDLVNSFDPKIIQASVCVTRTDITLAKEIHTYIPVVALERHSRFDLKGFINLRKYSKYQSAELYHAHGRSSFLFLITAKKFGVINAPIILHDHSSIEINQNTPLWFRLLGPRNFAHYVGVYEKMDGWVMANGATKKQVSIIGNALDMKRIDQYSNLDLHIFLQIPLSRKIGIMVGNLRPEKGLDLLIEAYSKCHFNNPPIIVILGRAPEDSYMGNCREQLKREGLEDNFIFVGQQSNVLSWMKGADFGVMPSRSESGPLVLAEMMACGLPIAAFRVGNISNLASNYLVDSFAQPNDTLEFSQILQDIANSSKSELTNKGNYSQQVAEELFDIKNKLPEWYAVYSSILDESQ